MAFKGMYYLYMIEAIIVHSFNDVNEFQVDSKCLLTDSSNRDLMTPAQISRKDKLIRDEGHGGAN